MSCWNRTGPRNGICERMGMDSLENFTPGTPMYGFPMKELSPDPSKVSARPLTTWSPRRVMLTKAWSRLINPPASIPARTPHHGEPVFRPKMKPVTAPISIIPSTPRFRIPDLSANISPIVAKSIGVPARIEATRVAMTKAAFIPPPLIAGTQGYSVPDQYIAADDKEKN